jgi:uncharacterized cupin superfamily protein
MRKYHPGDDVGRLDFWSFDNPASDYRITRGAPKTYGRIDAGGPGHTTRFGIWRCTEGAFDCTEQGDELMTVLSGRCRITRHADGNVCDLGPGDTLYVGGGSRVTWDVSETVTKVFFGHKAEGF